jgi:hypothetical protein
MTARSLTKVPRLADLAIAELELDLDDELFDDLAPLCSCQVERTLGERDRNCCSCCGKAIE